LLRQLLSRQHTQGYSDVLRRLRALLGGNDYLVVRRICVACYCLGLSGCSHPDQGGACKAESNPP
jgi:hypothetical protein